MLRIVPLAALLVALLVPVSANAAELAQHHGAQPNHGHRGWHHTWHHGWPGFGPGYGFVAPVVVEPFVMPVLVPPPVAVQYVPVPVAVPVAVAP